MPEQERRKVNGFLEESIPDIERIGYGTVHYGNREKYIPASNTVAFIQAITNRQLVYMDFSPSVMACH